MIMATNCSRNVCMDVSMHVCMYVCCQQVDDQKEQHKRNVFAIAAVATTTKTTTHSKHKCVTWLPQTEQQVFAFCCSVIVYGHRVVLQCFFVSFPLHTTITKILSSGLKNGNFK